MKARKILYICSGVFNCVVGGLGCFLGLIFFALSKIIKEMFAKSTELVDGFVKDLASLSSEYEYLLTASKEDVLSFIMKIVYIICVILIVLGLIWIVFGVFNCLLAKRHYRVFAKRSGLKVLFIVGSWLLLTLNIANITTTIAVYLKDKKHEDIQPLYQSGNNN